MGYILLVAVMMLMRTWCDVWMLKNGTAIESKIIARDYKGFLVVFLNFVLASFPIAGINNILKYGLHELALRFRTRLSQHLFKEYLKGNVVEIVIRRWCVVKCDALGMRGMRACT